MRRPVRKPSQGRGNLDVSGLYGFRVVLAKVPVIVEKEDETEAGLGEPNEE